MVFLYPVYMMVMLELDVGWPRWKLRGSWARPTQTQDGKQNESIELKSFFLLITCIVHLASSEQYYNFAPLALFFTGNRGRQIEGQDIWMEKTQQMGLQQRAGVRPSAGREFHWTLPVSEFWRYRQRTSCFGIKANNAVLRKNGSFCR